MPKQKRNSLYEEPAALTMAEFQAMSADAAIARSERELFNHPILTREQEVLLAKRIERGDARAKEMLIRCNMKLAAKIAFGRASACDHLTSDDLLIAAVQGLNRAAEKFDWRKGFKFSTYATNWIKQSIGREIANHEKLIRIPVHVLEQANEIRRIEKEYLQEHDRQISDEQIAVQMDMPLHEVTQLRRAQWVTSLDKPVGEEDTTLGSFVPADEPEIVDQVLASIESADLASAFEQLTDEQRSVVVERFINEKGLRDVAKELGKDSMSVRVLEREAMQALHAAVTRPDAQEAA